MDQNDTIEEADRRFDNIAEVTIEYFKEVLEIYKVQQEHADDLILKVRTVFQAQILYLRKKEKFWKAMFYYLEQPEELLADPGLMAVFEEAITAMDGRKRWLDYLANLRRRCPVKAQLTIIKGLK